jgi:predicted dinucleotide-binding enzyme
LSRCLIIGCGCRGRSLARELSARGHAVRGTTRDPARRAGIETAGAESLVADPDRVGTLSRALEHVTVVSILLGSAAGPAESVASLHGSRLEMLLHRMVDTTVRAVVYEARGSVDPTVLRRGGELVRAFCEDSRMPYRLLEADPVDHGRWLEAAVGAVEGVLALPPPSQLNR